MTSSTAIRTNQRKQTKHGVLVRDFLNGHNHADIGKCSTFQQLDLIKQQTQLLDDIAIKHAANLPPKQYFGIILCQDHRLLNLLWTAEFVAHKHRLRHVRLDDVSKGRLNVSATAFRK